MSYTIEDLSDPKTYEQDPALAKVARDIATDNYEALGRAKMRRGDFRLSVLSGHYPELVFDALQKKSAANAAQAEREQQQKLHLESAAKAVAHLVLPRGYTLSVIYSNVLLADAVVISGAWEKSLGEAIKRLGGYWDGTDYENLKAFVVPLANASKIEGVFARWQKRMDNQKKEQSERDRLTRLAAEAKQAARERQWEQEREQARQAREAERKEREQSRQTAKQDRILFPLGLTPPLNVPVKWGQRTLIFSGKGRAFPISEDHPAVHGSHLLGYEGDLGAYLYYEVTTVAPQQELRGEYWQPCDWQPAPDGGSITFDAPTDDY